MAKDPNDALDERLLALLRDDARAPVSSLAAAVHLCVTAVRRRLQRLAETGAIVGYTLTKRTPNTSRPLHSEALQDGPVTLEGADRRTDEQEHY